jgi:hypothetical protein
MPGQYIWSVVIVVLASIALLEAFPGRHATPVEPGVATMRWHPPSQTTPVAVDQPIDLATCRELQRQIAEHPDDQTRVTLACRSRL